MYKMTEEYVDYNGVTRKEDFYFNLTKAELLEKEMTTYGMEEMIQNIVDSKDTRELVKVFKDMVIWAYGVKSEDGRRFIKNDTVREDFLQTEAYSQIFMKLATDEKEAIKFVNGIMPPKEGNESSLKVMPGQAPVQVDTSSL